MPKDVISYSNTIIYKIFCNDKSVTDIYVGHTTNFIKRKYQHKVLCNSGKKLKLYDLIRENGGWDNWTMTEIAKYNCQDATEARIREQEHYDLLNPSLNLIKPISDNKYEVIKIDENVNLNINEELKCKKYFCEICQYGTDRKSSYDDHCQSMKHNMATVVNQNSAFCKTFDCDVCGKEYKDRSGLWRHKKKCNEDNKTETSSEGQVDNNFITKEMFMMLLKDNEDFKAMLMKVLENGIISNTNGNINTMTNSNNNNKTFNLQFFLNETCKNAMNIDEFVSSIEPTLEDLEHVGRVGYVEGISKIIIDKLNNTELTDRPIHCSDLKRETLYVKTNNVWNKETEDKPLLVNAIKEIASKNIQNIFHWQKKYPGCNKSDSMKNDLFLNITKNSMCGSSKEETNKNYEKIASNVIKKVSIPKV